MRRREFMVVLCGAVTVWPSLSRAQQPNRMRRLGVLMALAEHDAEGKKYIASFVQGLHELGWTDGDDIRVDYRWPGTDVGRIRAAAIELLDLKPDVILAMTPLTVAPLQQMTTTVPIVFVGVTDPLAAGIVASLARPGGNVTGVAALVYSIGGKSLEMLKEVAPAVSHVAVLYNPAQVTQVGLLNTIKTVAPSLGIQVSAASARDADEVSQVIDAFANTPSGGMVVLPNPITIANRGHIIALLARHRLPAIYNIPIFAREGGLMSYGADDAVQWHQAASYVDRILKGAKPADLPVQQATKLELIINLKTARALGLTVPTMLLATADEVIE
jgi:putative tryptophan/tyrosine transport system substrate-binding protein